MTNEDYLGITALALAELAELLANSVKPQDVRPLLIHTLSNATVRWIGDENPIKDAFVRSVKESIDEVQQWANLPVNRLHPEPELSQN